MIKTEQHFETQNTKNTLSTQSDDSANSANSTDSTQSADSTDAKSIRKILLSERGEFGMSAIIGIAIGLIIAAFILIPGLQAFANTIMSDMELWWTNSISSQIFPN